MYGGGGGSSAPEPAPIDYEAQARAQILVEQERARLEQENSERARAQELQDRQRLEQQFYGSLGTSYGAAEQELLAAITGGNLGSYTDRAKSMLNKQRTSIPFGDANPGAYFDTSSILDAIKGEATTTAQTGARNAYRDTFTPTYANTLLADTADDDIINAIIAEQYTPAADGLYRAFQRGTLNDTGYQSALRELDNMKSGASARLNSDGLGLINEGRQSINDIANTALSSLDDVSYDRPWNASTYTTQAQNTANTFLGSLPGRVRNLVGTDQLFDIGTLINKGGAAQGPTSGPTSLVDALAERKNLQNSQQRGLGVEGVF